MAETSYLEEAAAELVKARADNEKRAAKTANLDENHPVRKEIREERRWYTEGFIVLAAIKAGVGKVTMEYPVPGAPADPEE